MPERTNPIVRFAVERRVTMSMCMIGVLVLGWLSLQRLPLEFLPTLSSSHISVMAPYPSSSPEETERLIVRPLEEILGTVNGIETLTAVASADTGTVTLGFVNGTDMDIAAMEVRDRVDRVRDRLPADLQRVRIRRFQTSDIPVMRFDVSAPWTPDRLYRFVEEVVERRLERLEGVADVDVRGLAEKQLQVSVDPARLAATGLGIRDLTEVLRANNVNLSAGKIRQGGEVFLVRAVGELHSLDEVRALPLGRKGLRVGDVADVSFAYPEKDNFNFLNGSESLTIGVYKASTANLLQVADRVRAEMKAIQALPEAKGLHANFFFDSSQDVRKGLAELRNTGLLGGLLAIAFIFAFLRRFRTSLVVGIAIPLSVIVAFVIMYLSRQAGWTDMTLNILSLLGMMLAVGMLVDNSIVVIESIFRHRQELGEDARTATLRGASEVAMPIIASTLTTVCVFLPIIFLSSGGRFTIFLRNIGTTVVIVILASLLVALTVVPMAAVILLRRESSRRPGWFERFSGFYAGALRFSLRHRLAFSLLVIVLMGWSWHLYLGTGRSFFTRSFSRQLTLQVDTPKSYSVEQKDVLYRKLYDILDAHRKELEIADISYRYKRGAARSRGWRGTNRIRLYLVDEEHSHLGTAEIRDRVERLLPVEPGVRLTVARSMHGRSGSGSSLDIELYGDRPEVLEMLSRRVVATLRRVQGLRDVDTSLTSGDEEIHVRPNRERALQAGLSSRLIGMSIAGALSERAVSTFRTGDRELDVVVQYRKRDRQTLEQLKRMPLAFGRSPLPASALAGFEKRVGARTIERENHRSVIHVTADTAAGLRAFAVMGPVGAALRAIRFPSGYGWQMSSDFRRSRQEASNALFLLVFALVLVYMIMAALFESFVQPFVIMFSVPFAFVGVGIVMRLAGQPRGNMTDMGLIILAGIVVNNAIVLVDHINQLRRSGMSRNEAIVIGGRHRLRPILMTAITTVLGLLPMVLPLIVPQLVGAAEGRAAYWMPVGLVIMGGLTTSTFLTVTVIPIVYSLADDLTRFSGRIAREVAR